MSKATKQAENKACCICYSLLLRIVLIASSPL